jgi:hypothetical protein
MATAQRTTADPVTARLEKEFKSLKGFKAHATRTYNSLIKVLEYLDDNPGPTGEDCIESSLKEYNDARKRLEDKATTILTTDEFQTRMSDEVKKYMEDALDLAAERYDRINQLLMQVRAKLIPTPQPPPQAAPVQAAPPQCPKPIEALKPFKLRQDSYPNEVRIWKESFDAYYAASMFDQYGIKEQHMFLFACMNVTLAQKVRENDDYRQNMAIKGNDSVYEILDHIFDIRYPTFNKRLEYFRLRQAPRQSFSDWVAKLLQRSETADIAKLTLEEINLFRILTGTTDEELRKRLFLIQEPTLAKVKAEGQRYEALTAAENALQKERSKARQVTHKAQSQDNRRYKQPTSYRNRNNASTYKKNNPRGRGRQGYKKNARNKTAIPKFLQNKCLRCGSATHATKDCKIPQAKLYCKHCKAKGHVDKVCLKRAQRKKPRFYARQADDGASSEEYGGDEEEGEEDYSTGESDDGEEADANTVAICNYVSANQPTPQIKLTFRPQTQPKKRFSAIVTPDTGCTRTVISYDICKRHRIRLQKSAVKIRTASGALMNVAGEVNLTVRNATINALASKDLKSDVLLSWHDMQRLGMLPPEFPAMVCTAETITILDEIKSEFKDVLAETLDTDEVMTGPPMHIHLRDDTRIQPAQFLTARAIPLHLKSSAEEAVTQILEKGILARVERPTDWVSPGHFVPKPNGTARLVTDYTRLNQYVKRPIHPFPATLDILQNINPNSKWFAKLDAIHGYFQIPLDTESSYLTTFLLPSGRYRYTRAPMGLNASGDEFCMRTDMALQGLTGVSKLVDDILVEGATIEQLRQRLVKVLERCRKHAIKLSIDKLEIGQTVNFAGHIISHRGIKPDPKKVEAISAFPSPKDVTHLRSFLGLANQLGHFIPDLAQATQKMRQLLKKDAHYQWLNEHEEELVKVKKLLTSDLLVKPFDPELETDILTDASCLNGLGFALIQHEKDNDAIRLVSCGSCSITDTQKRYAPVELECLAVVWAITKCSFWLRGLTTFRIVTDHNPLLGVFNKPLSDIDNPRLLRMRTKIASYTFTITWQAGKAHQIADALSRSPVWRAHEDSEEENDPLVYVKLAHADNPELNLELEIFTGAVEGDEDYETLIKTIEHRTQSKNLPPRSPAVEYRSLLTRLSLLTLPNDKKLVIYDGNRILVPEKARDEILKLLHTAHQGITKTIQRAKQNFLATDDTGNRSSHKELRPL